MNTASSSSTMPRGNHRDCASSNDVGEVSLLTKDIERWNVIEEDEARPQEQRSEYRRHHDGDDMTQEVASLLQFMDQYTTFSPLLKNNNIKTIGHHDIEQYDRQSSNEIKDVNKDILDGDPNDDTRNVYDDRNQMESSFAHHSIVVSSSSSSNSHLFFADEPEHDATHNSNTIDASVPVPALVPPDQGIQQQHPKVSLPPSTTMIDMEREKLRTWVTQVRQAVYEWVQEYREYIKTVQQQPPAPQIMLSGDYLSVPQQFFQRGDTDQQIMLQSYEQTIVSLNEIIQDQRRRIHELETILGNEGNEGCDPHTGMKVDMSRTSHTSLASALHHRQETTTVTATAVNNYDDRLKHRQDENQTNLQHYSHRTKVERDATEKHREEGTTKSPVTTAAMILKTKNCKRIVYSNGTVHEIYYDDAPDCKSNEAANIIPIPNYRKQQQPRQRNKLYDVIRFCNGDVKMTTTTAVNGTRHSDYTFEEVWEETYYYYSKSGIIQIARHLRSHSRDPPTPTATNVYRCRTEHNPQQLSTIEYHYPNGQIEYHFGKERVIQFPDGRIRSDIKSKYR